MNRRAQLICLSSGPLLTVLFIIGAVFLGRFIPPLVDPSNPAQEVARKYAEHTDQIRLGALLTVISMSLIAPWGVTIAAQTRRIEGNFPILTYVQLMCVAIGTTIVVLMGVFWGITAFRPGEYPPQIVQYSNDAAYFIFLFTWPPFSVWTLAVALAILMDKSPTPVFPRWTAYLSLWTAILFIPAGLMAFFKTGPFAWNGLLALYIPVAIFFVWLIAMSIVTYQNIQRGYVHEDDAAPAGDRGPSLTAGRPSPSPAGSASH